MLAHHLRRWSNVKTAVFHSAAFAGVSAGSLLLFSAVLRVRSIHCVGHQSADSVNTARQPGSPAESKPAITPPASQSGSQASTGNLPNAGLMLAQRRRRWANIKPALDTRLVFAEDPRSGLVLAPAGILTQQPRPPPLIHKFV